MAGLVKMATHSRLGLSWVLFRKWLARCPRLWVLHKPSFLPHLTTWNWPSLLVFWRVNAELAGVLRHQLLPAELHCLGARYPTDWSSAEKAIQDIETDVPAGGAPCDEAAIDLVPQRQARAGAERFELPSDIAVLKQLGSVCLSHLCVDRSRIPHPGELYPVSNGTKVAIDDEGRPLAQMHRIG